MEFSGLTAIAPMLYVDWNKQMQQMAGQMGTQGLDKLAGITAGAQPAEQQPGSPSAGLAAFLGTFLGQQKEMLDSVMEMTIAHEVAHQWWAIAVGSDSVREPFVDESLTNYSAVLYFEDRYGKAAAEKMANLHLKMPYSMVRMFGMPDVPANQPTSAYQSNLQYSAVVYGKGALYYAALRRVVGDEVFFASLREYYRRYRGSLAGPKALLQIVQAKAPQAAGLYRHWIEETHGDEDIGGGQISGPGNLLDGLLKGLGVEKQ
jgi:hypothetical protein